MTFRSSDWCALGPDVFYRKVELFQLAWKREYDINLNNFDVVGSPFGGSIALVEKSRKKNVWTGDIWVFTSAGKLISLLKDISLGCCLVFFTMSEDIVTLSVTGQVTIYDLKSIPKRTFSLHPDIKEDKILEAASFRITSSWGIAVLTTSGKFYLIKDIGDIQGAERYPSLFDSTSHPSSWCVVTSNSAQPRIMYAQEERVFLLTPHNCVQLDANFSNTNFNTIYKMCSSLSGREVAMITDKQTVWFGNLEDATLNKKSEFATEGKAAVEDMAICGPEAVACIWKDIILCIGADNNYFNANIQGLRYQAEPLRLIPEIDGVRVINNISHELIEFVPPVVVDIFRIGSVSVGSILLDASKEYTKKSHKADDGIRLLNGRKEMDTAIRECIEAAAHEYHCEDQKILLEAALLGKSFSPVEHRDFFMDVCRSLRVLNHIRRSSEGIPLTFKQYEQLGRTCLIDRLLSQGNYSAATNIAEYLDNRKGSGVPSEVLRILRRWAIEKVHEFVFDDESTAKKIRMKLGPRPGISYSDIASEAVKCGRKALAVRLLEFEVKISQQIPLLLMLEQHQRAIERAIESGDSHLLFSVISRLEQEFTSREFMTIIKRYPQALNMYKNTLQNHDDKRLRNVLDTEEDFNGQGMSFVNEALQQEHDFSVKSLQLASSSFKKSKNDFASATVEEQMKLVKLQSKMRDKNHIDCSGMSLTDTLKKLLQVKKYKEAEEFRKDFKMSERRYWWVKVSVLADGRDWQELERFSRSKSKPPIGFEPFVDACLRVGDRIEATKYVNKVDPENRVAYLIKVGLLDEAAEFACERNDMEAMERVIAVSGPTQRARIEPLRRRMLAQR